MKRKTLFETKKLEHKNATYAKFEIGPLAQGYGHTLGNSLRRVLLSSLPGAAITQVKISGVKHQFSTLKGMKEDVLDLLLNLKKVRVSFSGESTVKGVISAKGPKEVKASDIKVSSEAKIANPDLVIASLAKDAKLEVQVEIEPGVGYSSSEERKTPKVGLIPLDAIFSPVYKVNYKVEETRVGRKTNYDKLIIDIWTDGTLNPSDALIEASKIIVSYFNQIISPKEVKEKVEESAKGDLGVVGKLSVEEIGLPTRVANALIKAGFDTVEKLFKATDDDLKKVRNLGEKSAKIVKAALQEKGVKPSDA